jgi:hypothetical protein
MSLCAIWGSLTMAVTTVRHCSFCWRAHHYRSQDSTHSCLDNVYFVLPFETDLQFGVDFESFKWTVLQMTFFWVPTTCGIICLFQDYRGICYPCLYGNFIRFRWTLKWWGGAGVSIICEGWVDFDLQEPWRGKQWRNFSVLTCNAYFFLYCVIQLKKTFIYSDMWAGRRVCRAICTGGLHSPVHCIASGEAMGR